MSLNMFKDGELINIAGGGNSAFIGTTAEVNAAISSGEIKEGMEVIITDDTESYNPTASDVSYDNTTSELESTNVQDSIDELNQSLTDIEERIDNMSAIKSIQRGYGNGTGNKTVSINSIDVDKSFVILNSAGSGVDENIALQSLTTNELTFVVSGNQAGTPSWSWQVIEYA